MSPKLRHGRTAFCTSVAVVGNQGQPVARVYQNCRLTSASDFCTLPAQDRQGMNHEQPQACSQLLLLNFFSLMNKQHTCYLGPSFS